MAATTFGAQSTKVLGNTKSTPTQGTVNATVRTFVDTYTTAAEVATAIIVIGVIPKGAVFLGGSIETDTTLGSSTVAISTISLANGVATVVGAGAFQAAATYTTVDTPVLFGKTAVTGVPAAADIILGLVVAVATMPTGAKIVTTIDYALN